MLNAKISPSLQYFLPFALDGINKQIEDAILKADRLGVKVISLAALNKVIYRPFLHQPPLVLHHFPFKIDFDDNSLVVEELIPSIDYVIEFPITNYTYCS